MALGDRSAATKDAIAFLHNEHFRVDDNGDFYLTIGGVETNKVMVWLDQAVLYCPYGGT